MIDSKLTTMTEAILNGKQTCISPEDALFLSALTGQDVFDLLFCSNKVRQHFKGSQVFTCVILNAKSGKCSQDCAFCAQSAFHNTGVEIYPLLSTETLVERALKAQEDGATNYSMVTSGHMLSMEDIDRICGATEIILQKTDLTVCASLGELTGPMAEKLRQSGITNYHHNLETAGSYFKEICTTHEYEEDIRTIQEAVAAGLRVCSGGILGLGETWEQRIELAATLRDLKVSSIPINFLNPIPGTRLENQPLLPPMEALQSIALFRMTNPAADITICGGREVTLKDFQSWVFAAGANGLMVGNYLTTQGRNIDMDMEMIRELGLTAV